MGSGDLDLLPLFMWPIGVSLTTVWVSWLLMGVPNKSFCHLPSHPVPRPSHPHPLLSILTAERDGKKYHAIQPSEIDKISYNMITKYFNCYSTSRLNTRLRSGFVTKHFKTVFLKIPLGAN